jgi:hypothetical protein
VTEALVQALVLKAVRRYVADAIRSGSFLSASACAAEIVKAHPHMAINEKAVAEEVAWAAAKAGVPVEIGRRRAPAPARRGGQRMQAT